MLASRSARRSFVAPVLCEKWPNTYLEKRAEVEGQGSPVLRLKEKKLTNVFSAV